MPRRKQPAIPDELLDQLLAGSDPRAALTEGGLLDGLKKALAERALNAELGVVQNQLILGHTGVRRPPACEGRISTGRVSCAGGGWPPRGQARWG